MVFSYLRSPQVINGLRRIGVAVVSKTVKTIQSFSEKPSDNMIKGWLEDDFRKDSGPEVKMNGIADDHSE